MKIGILTFSCAHNYGAILQCYALQETLKSMGYEVEVINYKQKNIIQAYRVFSLRWLINRNPLKTIKRTFNLIFAWKRRMERFHKFEDFVSSNIVFSTWNGDNGRGFPSDHDAYVIGSDQLWNAKLTGGFDPFYFAQFPFQKLKKIYLTYAISMGEEKIKSVKMREYIRKSLESFDAISVREDSLANLLQPLTRKKIEVVLDPTLIAPLNIWSAIAEKPHKQKKMVLLYQVKEKPEAKKISKYIAKQIGGEVIEIYSDAKPLFCENYFSASPADFVGYFMEADFVVTTSFHGTAFSIICQKPFYTLRFHNSTDLRVASLLADLGLSDRMIDENNLPEVTTINYSQANAKLERLKADSLAFLSSTLHQMNL